MNYFIILLFIIFCLYIAYKSYHHYIKSKKEKQYIENKEFLKKIGTVHTEMYFFHTKWCPHCKDAMPIWESIKKSSRFKPYKIHFMTIDCEDKKNHDLVIHHKIKEYPSYVLTAKGKNFVYDANLNSESLERFIKAVYEKL